VVTFYKVNLMFYCIWPFIGWKTKPKSTGTSCRVQLHALAFKRIIESFVLNVFKTCRDWSRKPRSLN